MGLNNSSLRNPEAGLTSLCEPIARVGSPALAELVSDCLAYEPEDRPSGYEEVLDRIKVATVRNSRKAVTVWRALRRPYSDRLAEFGLAF